MIHKLLALSLLVFATACWPGPSYKDKDPRCKEWNMAARNMNTIDRNIATKSLNVIDRYYYYICVNEMNTLTFPKPDIFVDDAEEILELLPGLLNSKIDGVELFLMAKICLKIATEKPNVANNHMALFNSIEAYADKTRDRFWGIKAMDTLRNARDILEQGGSWRPS